MGLYARALPDVYAKAGGRYLAIGGPGRGIEWLAGPWRDRSLVLARFDSMPALQRFWWGEDYRQAMRLREAAGAFTVIGVQGLPEPAGEAEKGAAYLVGFEVTRDPVAQAEHDATLVQTLAAHGGRLLAARAAGGYVALEGDPPWDRVLLARFDSAAALEAFLGSAAANELAKRREEATLLAVLARAQAASAPPPPR